MKQYSVKAHEWDRASGMQEVPYGRARYIQGILVMSAVTDRIGEVRPSILAEGCIQIMVVNEGNRELDLSGCVYSRNGLIRWEKQGRRGACDNNCGECTAETNGEHRVRFKEAVLADEPDMPTHKETCWRHSFRVVREGRDTLRTRLGVCALDSHFVACKEEATMRVIEDSYAQVKQELPNINEGDYRMNDSKNTYNFYGPVAAAGNEPKAAINSMQTMTQAPPSQVSQIDIEKLVELIKLLKANADSVPDAERHAAREAISSAETAARENDTPRAIGHLRTVGNWVVAVAKKAGEVGLSEWVKSQLSGP